MLYDIFLWAVQLRQMDDQRVNIKFRAKLGKYGTDTYNLIQQVYGDEALPCTCV